jgi:hypothetical protein
MKFRREVVRESLALDQTSAESTPSFPSVCGFESAADERRRTVEFVVQDWILPSNLEIRIVRFDTGLNIQIITLAKETEVEIPI